MIDRSGKRMGVFGMSGSGKTHFVKNAIRGMDRVIAFDPEEDFCELPGFIEVSSLQRFAEIAYDCWEGNFRIAYVPAAGREEQELSEISRLIERYQEPYKSGRSNDKVMLVVDELNLSYPINPNPRNDGFARICSRGRKRGINVIGISQRPVEVATRFRGNLDRLAVFKLALSNDWVGVERYVGKDGETKLRDAGDFSHIFWENGDSEVVAPT